MGYKREQFAKKLDQNLQCPICIEIFDRPMTCNAGHTFCYECIKTWLATNKRCPADNTLLVWKSLVPNLTVKGIIDELDVYCHPRDGASMEFRHPPSKKSKFEKSANDEEDEENCSWTGKLHELEAHRKTCGFQQITCTYSSCFLKIKRKDLEKHKETCKYRPMVCKKCGASVLHGMMQNHLEECPNAMIPCPKNCITNGEVTKFRRSTAEDHIMLHCPMVLIDCQFAEQGCVEKVLRGEYGDHMKDAVASHMTLLAKQNAELQKELTKTKDLIDLSNCYIWKIDNFAKRVEEMRSYSYFFTSSTFHLCGMAWHLTLHPYGKKGKYNKVQIFLNREEVDRQSVQGQMLLLNGSINLNFSISVLNRKGNPDPTSSKCKNFLPKTSFGFTFMSNEDAISPNFCDASDGSFTIKCTIAYAPQ